MNVHDQSSTTGPLAVIVMGVSGSGKSTLGAALAGIIGCPFLEGDDFHSPEAKNKMRAGIPLTDEDRWPWLARLSHAIDSVITGRGVCVASCSALKRAYRDYLRKALAMPARFILLDADRAELLRRMTARAQHYMPASLLMSQLATLERPRPDEAVLTLDATRPAPALCAEVLRWLGATAHGSTQTRTSDPRPN